ncbi:MAG TPA: transglutaminase-like cysteine peptidase [Caulobacteraceae bacterium]
MPDHPGAWSALVADVRDLPLTMQVAAVNVWVNHHVAFATDQSVYGVADHWASLAETLAHGRGDCEDFAIAKMQLLAAAGVPAWDMYLILVRDTAHHVDHAFLAVRDDGRYDLLDSNQDGFVAAGVMGAYQPVLAFSAAASWTFGYRQTQGPAGPAVIAPAAAPSADAALRDIP